MQACDIIVMASVCQRRAEALEHLRKTPAAPYRWVFQWMVRYMRYIDYHDKDQFMSHVLMQHRALTFDMIDCDDYLATRVKYIAPNIWDLENELLGPRPEFMDSFLDSYIVKQLIRDVFKEFSPLLVCYVIQGMFTHFRLGNLDNENEVPSPLMNWALRVTDYKNDPMMALKAAYCLVNEPEIRHLLCRCRVGHYLESDNVGYAFVHMLDMTLQAMSKVWADRTTLVLIMFGNRHPRTHRLPAELWQLIDEQYAFLHVAGSCADNIHILLPKL